MESKDFKYKYLKYKQKYLDSVTEINRLKSMLNNQMGGATYNNDFSEQLNDPLLKVNYLSETPVFQQGGRYTDISSSDLHSTNLESSELETFIKRNMVGGETEDEESVPLPDSDTVDINDEEDESTEKRNSDDEDDSDDDDLKLDSDEEQSQEGGYSTSFTELDNIFGGAREDDSDSDLSISSLDSTSLNSSDDEFNLSPSD